MADPWFKFYPTDWRADPALKMCSLAARGLWIEMIALMHEATPYGHLVVSGRSPTDAQIAVLAGASSAQVSEYLGELEAAGVFSRTKDGVIYSRKMSRASKKAAIARKNGKNGGNPSLRKETENKPSDNQIPTNPLKPQKPEARSQIIKEAKASSSEADEAVADYNDAARRSGWAVVQRLSKARLSAVNARLRDAGGLEGWRAALAKAEASDFLCGRRPGRDGPFFASFDFLTQASSFARLVEGTYDNRTNPGQPAPAKAASDDMLAQIWKSLANGTQQ